MSAKNGLIRASSKARESIFDTLQGVGPARRRALLQHFGSAERFLAASQEELARKLRDAEDLARAKSTSARRALLGLAVAVGLGTITLVLAAKLMPVWAAKAIAILVSFVVNFSITHLVVFRTKSERVDVAKG